MTIAVFSDATPAVAAFELIGTGAVPALVIGNNPLDLGGAKLGQTTATQAATLSNVGNVSLSVTSIAATTAPFAQVGGTWATPPFTLAPGASCSLEYRFTAAAIGGAVQALTIASTAPDSPATLQLLARGTQATLSIAPAPLDFGTLAVGPTSAPTTVTLTNTASVPLAVGTLALAGGLDFAIASDACSGQTIPAAGTCQVALRFTPVAPGAAVDLLSVPSDAIGSPKTLPM